VETFQLWTLVKRFIRDVTS